MVKNGFKSVFCTFRFIMDFFDKFILNVLKDEGSRDFRQLLGEVDLFSHNMLKLYLSRLVDRGLVVKEKMSLKGLGRPRFAYSLSPELRS